MKCLAVDIGSTSIKGAILDLDRSSIQVAACLAFPAPLANLPAHHVEVSPNAIEQAIREVLTVLLSAAPEAERLYCSSQMGGLLLTDAAGVPRSNYLCWRDQRTRANGPPGDSSLDETRKRLGAKGLAALGNELQSGSTLALLSWLEQRRKLVPQGMPLTIGDYVVGKLCGATPRMHITQAAGLLDLEELEWNYEAFEQLGLSDLGWPELIHGIEPCGYLKIAGRKLQVFGSYGDQQCALYGAELALDELSINISTGSQVSRRVGSRTISSSERFQTRPYFEGDLLQTVTHLPAGRSLNVLVDLLTELAAAEGIELRDPWGSIERLVDETTRQTSNSGSAGLDVDLSFFAGPVGETGAIRGVTTENLSVGRLFDTAFRSMAENYARVAEWLAPAGSYRGVVLSGSLARRIPRLRSWLRAQFDVPQRVANDEETLLGLLRLAVHRQCHASKTQHE